MAPHEVDVVDSTFSAEKSSRPHKKIDSILQARGTQIVDGHGDPVILKGVSLNFS